MRKRLGILFAIAAAAAITVACGASDAGITTKVKAKIAADREVTNSDRIEVTTQDKVVTLSGTADSQASKERAETLARSTEGVTNVIDNLTVAGASASNMAGNPPAEGANPSAEGAPAASGSTNPVSEAAGKVAEKVDDVAITSAVKAKLIGDSDVAARKIDVDTKDGVVTLKGTVSSEQEKDKALQIARNTKGVQRVEDQLMVRSS
ncbi:MAG TPA: BON domain-containing protein [Thermoanaerobaculia bacterium]